MSDQGMQDRTDKLRSQVWRHLELGQWHSAALLAERMTDIDPLSALGGLAEATRALAAISEAIRLNDPIDPHILVRLDEIGRTWPRLAAMRSFQALAKAVEEASARGHEPQTSMPDAAVQGALPKPAASSRPKPGRSILRRILRPEGCAGIGATMVCVLVVLLVLNSVAYCYLREQPISTDGPESGGATWQITEPWHGLIDLEHPVDTVILGDSTAGVNLLPGPIADRLGGTAINLSTNFATSLLMDAWMLQYYLDKFGAPRNVILLRNCHGYETEPNLELMASVPLSWGYWERLGISPEWGNTEKMDLSLLKYGVLYSSSDILAYRLTHPLDLVAQPYSKRDATPYYFRGSMAPSALDDFRRENTVATYTPFLPTSDSERAVSAMSEQAKDLGFQLYLVVGPEWDEAYQDPDRRTKVTGMVEWFDQFTDSQYVHVVLREPMIFRGDQMQNINHLRPGAEKLYNEAVVTEIVGIQNGLTSGGAIPLQLSSVVSDKGSYAVGEEPSLALSLMLGSGADTTSVVGGSISCLLRWSGKSDGNWVSRAPGTTFSLVSGSNTEVILTPSEGSLALAGAYDLVVFIRQDMGGLSHETRVQMPKVVRVT